MRLAHRGDRYSPELALSVVSDAPRTSAQARPALRAVAVADPVEPE